MPDRLTPAEYRALAKQNAPEPSGGADGTRCREAMSSAEHEAYRRHETGLRARVTEGGETTYHFDVEAFEQVFARGLRRVREAEVRMTVDVILIPTIETEEEAT